MPAFCRFKDSSGHVRLALAKNFENADDPSRSPKVCPLDDVVDAGTIASWLRARRWITDATEFVALVNDQISRVGGESSLPWQPPPERLLPPIDAPNKILCIGLNYRDHAIETGADIPHLPVVFSKLNTSLIGHGDPVVLPRISDQVDFEAELVVVVGKQARHVSPADAMNYVFGYTAGNDVSSRDWQKGRPGGQWLLGKAFDSFAPVGPCVVTADQMGNPDRIPVSLRLNGEIMQDSDTSQLIFSIPHLIAHLSQFMTLQPGDLIFTGTPPGVGAARTPPRFLADKDRCEVTIGGVGSLVNPCVNE